MKKIYYLLLVLVLFAYSCEDVLNKAPLNIISEDVVFNDPKLVRAYINGIYNELSFLNREGFGYETVDPTSCLSDEGRCGRSWHWLYYYSKAGFTNKDGGLLEIWNYSTIRKANEFLEKIEKSTAIATEDKKEMVAQVKFARAIVYFYMVKRYGGIPIITEAQAIDAPKDSLFVHRNKEIDVYDFIINEMDAIANDLPTSNTKIGFPTKYAALALKSRTAMYAASIATWGKVDLNGLVGIPANEAQRFWQASYDASKEIIDSHEFSLYNKYPGDKAKNFQHLFLDENNSEVIFSWQLTGVNVGSNYDLFTQPFHYVTWGGANTAVYMEMVEEFENIDGTSGTFDVSKATSQTWDLNDFFSNKDPRFHASIFYEGSIWKGEPVENWGGIILPNGTKVDNGYYEGKPAKGRDYTCGGYAGGVITGFNVKKYCDEALIPVESDKTKIDFIVFRLGEILLNYAEAAYELNKQDESLDAVNQIRQRAGIALLTNISRDRIRHERKVELAFEDQRWWDLKRWRVAVDAITRTFRGIYTFYDVNTGKFKIEMNNNADGGSPAVFKEQHYYMPITPARIANNPNLAPENPGY
jgi:hypothetical protein